MCDEPQTGEPWIDIFVRNEIGNGTSVICARVAKITKRQNGRLRVKEKLLVEIQDNQLIGQIEGMEFGMDSRIVCSLSFKFLCGILKECFLS